MLGENCRLTRPICLPQSPDKVQLPFDFPLGAVAQLGDFAVAMPEQAEEGDLLVKDLTTGAIKQRIAFGPDPAAALSFSPDGKLLIACIKTKVGNQRLVKVWSVAD